MIAGGTSGIGARAAELFASEGAAVVVGGRREPEGKDLVVKLGPRARFVPTDVTVESDVEDLIGDAVVQFGRLDVVINNAGIGGNPPGGLDTIDLSRFWAIMAVHVGGVLAGMKYAARVMLGQGSGSIVNTASTGGRARRLDGDRLLGGEGGGNPADPKRRRRARRAWDPGEQRLSGTRSDRHLRQGGGHGPGRC